jgi:hypothetical protein
MVAGRVAATAVAMVSFSENVWREFIVSLRNAMEDFQHGKIDMRVAVDSLEKYETHISPEVLEFSLDCISEIDGNPQIFARYLELLNSGATFSDIDEFMRT